MAGSITVVVVTRNRQDELARTLPRHEAPVVVVDSGSSDGTAAVARAAPAVIEVVELAANHGAYARTIGALCARTPYVAFSDDDSWWAPGSLERAVKVLREYPRLAVLAAQVRVLPQDVLDPLCGEMADPSDPMMLGRREDLPGTPVRGFMACGAVVHRGAFLSVGGFDDIVRFPGEEERVALDLAAAGLGLAYVPEVVAYHEPSPRREDPALRAARVMRSRLLTALLRRPWSAVRRDAAAALRTGGTARRGLLAALPAAPAALRHRSVVDVAPREGHSGSAFNSLSMP